MPGSVWLQKQLRLRPKSRGFHLVSDEVLGQLAGELKQVEIGLLHLFIQHTSAALTINENADPDVRFDMETYFNKIAPESGLPLRHTIEGPDDMPAHVKSSLLGCSLILPVGQGCLVLGTWQGIYLCEHRNQAGPRSLIATLYGQGRQ
jgi:secondary thiamine-phosphate synthase enzyme